MSKLNQSVHLDFSPERAVALTVRISLEAGSLDTFRASWGEICNQVDAYMKRVSVRPLIPQPTQSDDKSQSSEMLQYTAPDISDTQERSDADDMASVIRLIRENKINRPRRGRKPKPATQDNDPLNGIFDFYIVCQNKKNFPNAIAKLPGDIVSQSVHAGEASVKFERMGAPVRIVCLSHPDQIKAIKDRKDVAVVRTDNWFGPTDDPLTSGLHAARKNGLLVMYDTHFLRDWSRGFPIETKELADVAG